MKRVSFEIAMTLKEAGYPQELNDKNEYYSTNIDKDNPDYEIVDEPFTPYSFETSVYEYYVAPTYLEAWLWLWREKGIQITTGVDFCCIWVPDKKDNYMSKTTIKNNDPEEAIETAVDYLFDNDLIK